MNRAIKDIIKQCYAAYVLTKFMAAHAVASSERRDFFHHYALSRLFPGFEDERHLAAAMRWLALAQDACGGNGVSAVYSLNAGWDEAYPETSGYIIATYLAFTDVSGDSSYLDKAVRIGDWEVAIQAANGGVLSRETLRQTRVFNTGQVILGWCALYERTRDQRYLDAAVRAGEYLMKGQDKDGAWRTDTYCGARTYHARVDWSLLRLAKLSGDRRFHETACRNIAWVLNQQRENGWFDQCGFHDQAPITHVLAYTFRGLLECHLAGPAIDDLKILPAVIKAADGLCAAVAAHPVRGIAGMVPTSFNSSWTSRDQHSCLTGNAQIACFLFRLFQHTQNPRYAEVARLITNTLKLTHNVETSIPAINGAVAGSFPIYTGYLANAYPNWAAKFFADALLMQINLSKNLAILA